MDVLCLVKNVVVQSQHQDLFREVIIGSGLFSIPLSNCLLEKTVFFFWKIIQAVVVRLLSCVWLLWPYGLQHVRLPCHSPHPRACSNSCPLSWWCHPTISSSVIPFSFYPLSFPASGSFPVSWLFSSAGQSIGSFSFSSSPSREYPG